MNAVNLIPTSRRSSSRGVTASPAFLGLVGTLALALVAVLLVVTGHNRVTARRAELAQVTAGVNRWTAAAGSYAKFIHQVGTHDAHADQIRQLAESRFDWSRFLQQVVAQLPADAAPASLQATAPSGGSSTETSSAAGAAAATSGASPGVALSGCATSQPVVAATMDRLRGVTGVSSVTLSTSSSDSSDSSSSSSAATPASSGECPYKVQFQMSLTLSAPGSSAAVGTTGSSVPATSAPTTTTSAAEAAQ